METSRIGYDLIINEIPPRSRVLDLGCGDGALLRELIEKKDIEAFGVEISAEGVSACLEKGLFCYQGDIDDGLSDYRDNSFDYVILNQTLQDTKKPEFVLYETLRIGHNAIISFPNFEYIWNRFQIMFTGRMPKNKLLPFSWYETPNIHLLSIRDFHDYIKMKSYPVNSEKHFSMDSRGRTRLVRVAPNLFAEYGFFILDGSPFTS